MIHGVPSAHRLLWMRKVGFDARVGRMFARSLFSTSCCSQAVHVDHAYCTVYAICPPLLSISSN